MAIAEATLGAVFGELLNAVSDVVKAVSLFKPTLKKLQSTLTQLSPVIEAIEKLNAELERPKELESIIAKIKEGTELVRNCSNITKRDFVLMPYYQKKLDSLSQDLQTFINNMIAPIARDQKEILVLFKRFLAERNMEDTNGASSSDSNTTTPPVRSPIIGSEYCATSTTMLEIVKNDENLGFSHKFEVKDADNKAIFHLKRSSISIDRLYTLYDYHGKPIITLHKKIMTAHHRWEVYKDEQMEELLFNIKREHMIGSSGRLEVFLAENTSDETRCDYMINGNTNQGSYSIYVGHSRHPIAQVDCRYNGPATFGSSNQAVLVRVQPNVDYAFIVALFIVILS